MTHEKRKRYFLGTGVFVYSWLLLSVLAFAQGALEVVEGKPYSIIECRNEFPAKDGYEIVDIFWNNHNKELDTRSYNVCTKMPTKEDPNKVKNENVLVVVGPVGEYEIQCRVTYTNYDVKHSFVAEYYQKIDIRGPPPEIPPVEPGPEEPGPEPPPENFPKPRMAVYVYETSNQVLNLQVDRARRGLEKAGYQVRTVDKDTTNANGDTPAELVTAITAAQGKTLPYFVICSIDGQDEYWAREVPLDETAEALVYYADADNEEAANEAYEEHKK